MGFPKNGLHFADVAGTGASEISNLLPNIDLLSFWQICQTLIFPVGNLIRMSLSLKTGLLLQG